MMTIVTKHEFTHACDEPIEVGLGMYPRYWGVYAAWERTRRVSKNFSHWLVRFFLKTAKVVQILPLYILLLTTVDRCLKYSLPICKQAIIYPT